VTLPDTRYRLVMGVALFILIPAIAKIASVPEATTAPHQPTGQMAGADSAMEEVSLPPTATMTPPLLPTTVALVPDQGEVIRRRPLHPVSTPTLTPVPPKAIRVPILMYHHIADPPVGADAIRVDLSVSPASFADQMAFLVRNRYQTVTLGDLAGALTAGTPLPQRPVILTFDDGYDDNYLNAFPILQAWGLTGTFFIITDLVGSREYMSWEDLRVMASHGMDIEAHGRTHRDLTQLSADGVAWQARGGQDNPGREIGAAPCSSTPIHRGGTQLWQSVSCRTWGFGAP
jgi:hypothetical protein